MKAEMLFENVSGQQFTVIATQPHMGHSAHLGTARCPSSKLVPKFEKGDNLMKGVYLAYWGNG